MKNSIGRETMLWVMKIGKGKTPLQSAMEARSWKLKMNRCMTWIMEERSTDNFYKVRDKKMDKMNSSNGRPLYIGNKKIVLSPG